MIDLYKIMFWQTYNRHSVRLCPCFVTTLKLRLSLIYICSGKYKGRIGFAHSNYADLFLCWLAALHISYAKGWDSEQLGSSSPGLPLWPTVLLTPGDQAACPVSATKTIFYSIISRSHTSCLYITEGPIHLHTDPDRSWKLPSWFCRSGRAQVFLQEKSRRPSFLSSLLCNRGSSLSSWSRCILKLSKVWLENWLDNQGQSMTLLPADGGIQ